MFLKGIDKAHDQKLLLKLQSVSKFYLLYISFLMQKKLFEEKSLNDLKMSSKKTGCPFHL